MSLVEFEPRTFCLEDQHSATKPQRPSDFFLVTAQGSLKQLRIFEFTRVRGQCKMSNSQYELFCTKVSMCDNKRLLVASGFIPGARTRQSGPGKPSRNSASLLRHQRIKFHEV